MRRARHRGGHLGLRGHCNRIGWNVSGADRCAIAAIHRAPEGYRKTHGEYRHLVLRRFPFGVFYLFDGTTIAVVAMLNLRQDPDSVRAMLK